jgi:hypothetical protein
MTKYQNLSGKSDVDSYEYTDETFTVKFNEGTHYLYSTQQKQPDRYPGNAAKSKCWDRFRLDVSNKAAPPA